MPETERLYYNDSHLIEFEARVIHTTDRVSGWTGVTLDRTAFYPTGGGQPSDTGTLNNASVLECIDDEENGIVHVVQGIAPAVGSTVKGQVDWPRRLDHIQQHTGQHILSQAFVTLFDAATRGFRVLSDICEVDIDLKDTSEDKIERAVELANNVIWEDRKVTIKTATSDEVSELNLRKEPSREGELRLIEIEGFDLTPCGGTHAHRTGEVGIIVVRSWERAKGLTRIEFAAGTRAAQDYRRANNTARGVGSLFSASRDDSVKLAARMVEENKALHRRVRTLQEVTAEVDAEHLWSMATGDESGLRVVKQIFDGYDAEYLKRIAHHLMARPSTIALLASRDGDDARLVFARSADAAGDMNELMRKACEIIEGRGGGKPDLAQGGGKKVEKLEDALDAVAVRSEQ